MHDIRHRVGIDAPIGDVYNAVATRDGVATWWTRDVRGESRKGGTLEFFFGGPDASAVMEVTELTSPKKVQWRCINGPDEWKDTTITFDIKETDDETAVVFTHGGWREPVEFMNHCSTRWALFLMSLKAGLEGGTARPFPNDVLSDSWGRGQRS